MGSLGNPFMDTTITNPESLTDKELRNTSLRDLSKNLPQTTSSRSTISVYLRWLEIHRVAETRLTIHWPNTLLHWSQSLRSRGFRESEIDSEVRKWKKANPDLKPILRREPPDLGDIAKAFGYERAQPSRNKDRVRENRREREKGPDERKERVYDRMEGDSYRPLEKTRNKNLEGREKRGDFDDQPKSKSHVRKNGIDKYDQLPPGNYVCNRCGKKGHHLQVCPTNMDPSYDLPPEDNYVCGICDVRGKHFKSLCPQNNDPYSLHQRRKKKGIEITPVKKGTIYLSDWERDIDKQKSSNRLESRDLEQGRLNRVSDSVSSSSCNSLTPSQAARTREKLQEIEEKKRRLCLDESVEMTGIITTKNTSGSVENDLKRGHDQERYNDVDRMSRTSSPRSEAHGDRKRARTSRTNNNNNNNNTSKSLSSTTTKSARKAEKLFSDPPCNDDEKREKHAPARNRFLESDHDEEEINNGEPDQNSWPFSFESKLDYSTIQDTVKSFNIRRTLLPAGQDYEIDTEMTDNTDSDDYRIGSGFNTTISPLGHQSFALRPLGKSPGSMSIDETDSSSPDDMDIGEQTPLPIQAKIFHPYILELIQTRCEMSEVINLISRRPTALDMWNKNDLQRKERRTTRMLPQNEQPPSRKSSSREPSPREATTPQPASRQSTPSNQNERSPSQDSAYYEAEGFYQFDGASDERETKPSPSRKISAIGREGVEKMKEFTANVTKSFPTLKIKGRSPYHGSSKTSDADDMNTDSNQSDASISSMHVHAASSALKLTKANVESVASDAGVKDRASNNSSDSLAVNLPGNRVPVLRKKNVAPIPTQILARSTGQVSTFGQTQSSRDIQHATQQARLDDLKQLRGTFKLPSLAPVIAMSLMVNEPTKHSEFRNKSVANAMDASMRDEARDRTKSVAQPADVTTDANMRMVTEASTTNGKSYWCEREIKYTEDEMKQFSKNFNLPTPVPEDIAELFKQGGKT